MGLLDGNVVLVTGSEALVDNARAACLSEGAEVTSGVAGARVDAAIGELPAASGTPWSALGHWRDHLVTLRAEAGHGPWVGVMRVPRTPEPWVFAALLTLVFDAAQEGQPAWVVLVPLAEPLDQVADLAAYLVSGAHAAPAEVFDLRGRRLKQISAGARGPFTRLEGEGWASAWAKPAPELRGDPTDGLARIPEPTVSAVDDDTQVGTAFTRRWPIGKRYDGGFELVDESHALAMASAVGDEHPAYQGPGAMAPPMYHVRPFLPVLRELRRDPELDLDGQPLHHAEHTMRFRRALRHGQVLQLRATLESVLQRGARRELTFGLYGMVEGGLALEGTTTFTVGPRRPTAPHVPQRGAVLSTRWTPDVALVDRWAEATADHDPVHLDAATAVAAGFRGPRLHDLCVLALAQREVVAYLRLDDPARLVHLGAGFGEPAYPGDSLTFELWQPSEGLVTFVVRNAEGHVVLLDGRAEIRA